MAAGGTAASCNNNTLRNIPANANANAQAEVFLMQPWARPNLVNPPGTNTVDPRTGNAIYDTGTPAPSFYASLQALTADNTAQYLKAIDFADNDGSGGFAGLVPVGQAFMLAIELGLATGDMYAADALMDGLIDLWFNDGTHASVAGSYLSALTFFGKLTGQDPAQFGAGERAANDLGLSGREAWLLQQVASIQLGFRNGVIPAPATALLALLALLALGAQRRGGRFGG